MSNIKVPKEFSKLKVRPPLPVQILAILGYTAFAIPVSIIAMGEFGILGIFVVLFVIWGWSDIVNLGGRPSMSEVVDRLKPQSDEPKTTGNASFDAYKAELLDRLEKEQTNFEGFLTRLREAKDKTEFDSFMVDRERAARVRSDAQSA